MGDGVRFNFSADLSPQGEERILGVGGDQHRSPGLENPVKFPDSLPGIIEIKERREAVDKVKELIRIVDLIQAAFSVGEGGPVGQAVEEVEAVDPLETVGCQFLGESPVAAARVQNGGPSVLPQEMADIEVGHFEAGGDRLSREEIVGVKLLYLLAVNHRPDRARPATGKGG